MATAATTEEAGNAVNTNHQPTHANIPVFHNSPTFQMACRQLDAVAEVIEIDKGVLQRLSLPKHT